MDSWFLYELLFNISSSDNHYCLESHKKSRSTRFANVNEKNRMMPRMPLMRLVSVVIQRSPF